ncbi:polysaccharide biosynthesis protein [Candidatus Pelagibacter sp. HIMB1746]|uniref:polysaccharide biosynthesis protein n=1 Tax=Candidatus Pelagibacter sp. HIMB1746 TaxID=3413370 RepID=UPI003F854E7C
MFKFLNKKVVLITGGTGSFGKKAVNFLLNKTKIKKIIILSRDEQKHHKFNLTLPPKNRLKVRFFIGDIRDYERVKMACNEVDYIIHAAAMKHVYLSEYNPNEAISSNILGTQNIIKAAIENRCKKMILLSTDKAVEPINLYGASKLCAEKIVIASNAYSSKQITRFAVVRYGNVIASEGSVIQRFLEIKKNKEKFFNVTSENMTRFWINFDKAVNFVFNSLNECKGGEIYVPKMENFKITDIAKSIDPKKKIKFIGSTVGEKDYEKLITEYESLRCVISKNKFVIYPDKEFIFWDQKNKNYNLVFNKKKFSYSSDKNIIINKKKIKNILQI